MKIIGIKWRVVLLVRPPLTPAAMHGALCPDAITATDGSFWWGGS